MKNFVIFVLVIAILGGIGYFVITQTDSKFNLASWQGYSTYAAFSKAIEEE